MNNKIIIKSLVFSLSIVFIGVALHYVYGATLLRDENSAGWMLGVLGTIYALIGAFMLVSVWEQFNSLGGAISEEAQKITSIWNFTDYFNDDIASAKMQEVLSTYIDTVTVNEANVLAKNIRVVHPSQGLVAIMKVIDSIEFDDKRDESAFKAIIAAYEELSRVRSSRIQLSIERIPKLLRLLFLLMSFLMILFGLSHMFNSIALYISGVFGLSLIISLAYLIIDDLDNPFKGMWNADFEALDHAKMYINAVVHTK